MTTTSRLCVTITAPTTAELRRQRDLVTDADLIELRLDSVSDPDVAGALEGRTRPVIVTCRARWEGGGFDGPEEARRAMLAQALDLGADFVDIEWRAGFTDLLRTHGPRIVLSSHDFTGVPADLRDQARQMRATGAGVVKIAVKASRLTDCLTLLDLSRDFEGDQRHVLIAMGDAGLASRVLAQRFGSAWTYAGTVRDVGQITSSRLLETFRFRTITADTALYGLAGLPIGHSVSPDMHNAAFAAAGLDAVYLPLPAADADDFVTFAKAFGLRGASVTIPYKVALFDRVHDLDDLSRTVGALNTLKMEGDRWSARNTDVAGFLQPLRERHVPLQGRRAAILGAGGSARAVAVGLASAGAHVTVHARDTRKARVVADVVGGATGSFPPVVGSSGSPGELHAGRHAAADRRESDSGVGVRARSRRGVRPHLQPGDHASHARRGDGRLRCHRRSRHARRTGAGAVRVVDRRSPTSRCDARRCQPAAFGVQRE
ncbi:MAG: type I 3-dehydroquinate dehydratase [Vicinamibacterales bacterium]